MTEKTILSLVDDVCLAANELGMDLSVSDVAFIVATFLEGLAAHPSHSKVNVPLLAIATEVCKAQDER